MPVRNLDKIFKPRSVAVIGASPNPSSVGHTVLQNLETGGFTGPIWPVNPKYEQIGDRACHAGIGLLPEPPDLAVVCTPARTLPAIVRECGEAGVRGLLVLSAGFGETGAEGKQLERELCREAARFDGLRIVGPNCLGIIAPHSGLNASFANGTPAKGHVAFLSQSGALCTAVLDWALKEKIGFSHFMSIGNMVDVGLGDLIDYLATDAWTESLVLYVESVTNAREFMSAARAFSRGKPIIAYKAGRFAESARAAASHTGALAGVDAVYEAAFRRAGIVRIFEMTEMFDCAELLARHRAPAGPRLAIVTNAGGPGVMATDALVESQGELAVLADATLEALNGVLPAAWSHNNPVDVLGDASGDRLAAAVRIVLADPGVDSVLVIFTPQAMSRPTEAAQSLVEVARHTRKPVLASWMGGLSMSRAVELLNDAGIPTYPAPEQAVRAHLYLVSYARTRELLHETPRELPVALPAERAGRRAAFEAMLAQAADCPAKSLTLSERDSKALLAAYGIPVVRPVAAHSAAEAVARAREIGYPVVLKLLSPQITHKTDVGGVVLDLADDDAVSAAFQRIVTRAARERPDAQVEGVTVQRMVASPVGCELIAGARHDAVFGTVMLVGAGGTATELFHDRALELPPLTERLARRMLESLRSWPLLQGFRGRPALNVDRLIEVLVRLSCLVADCPEIDELDVNPLLVTPDDAVALDARVILDAERMRTSPAPYSHLAIRPYPEEFSTTAAMKDGTQVLLRPIKPEDEPLWHEMLASCSRESLWFRFQYLFQQTTHAMAARYCFIDYDREMAIVAELNQAGRRRIAGVGRLVADADRSNAEYAILVADEFQGRGLGALLTDYCLDICRRWGMNAVLAETSSENHRMLDLFRHRGFEFEHPPSSDVILARKRL